MMSFEIHLDTQNKLIRYQHSGIIRKEDIGKAWDRFLQMDEFTKQGYNLVSDYSDAKFDASIEDVGQIIQILKSIQPIIAGKRQALIITQPLYTALSMLFEESVNSELGFIVKVFATEKSALNWI